MTDKSKARKYPVQLAHSVLMSESPQKKLQLLIILQVLNL